MYVVFDAMLIFVAVVLQYPANRGANEYQESLSWRDHKKSNWKTKKTQEWTNAKPNH